MILISINQFIIKYKKITLCALVFFSTWFLFENFGYTSQLYCKNIFEKRKANAQYEPLIINFENESSHLFKDLVINLNNYFKSRLPEDQKSLISAIKKFLNPRHIQNVEETLLKKADQIYEMHLDEINKIPHWGYQEKFNTYERKEEIYFNYNEMKGLVKKLEFLLWMFDQLENTPNKLNKIILKSKKLTTWQPKGISYEKVIEEFVDELQSINGVPVRNYNKIYLKKHLITNLTNKTLRDNKSSILLWNQICNVYADWLDYNSAVFNFPIKIHPIKEFEVQIRDFSSMGINGQGEWDNAVTPIEEINSPNSRFFTYSVKKSETGFLAAEIAALRYALQGYNVTPEFWSNPLTDFQSFARKPSVAFSYQGPHRKNSLNPAGYILDVPPENIYFTWPDDAGGNTLLTHEVANRQLKHKQNMSPDELLAFTSPKFYNELNAVGTHPETHRSIKVIGVFVQKNSEGKLLVSGEEFKFWLLLAHENNIPFYFLDKNEEEQTSIDLSQQTLLKKILNDIEPQPFASSLQWKNYIMPIINKYLTPSNILQTPLFSIYRGVGEERENDEFVKKFDTFFEIVPFYSNEENINIQLYYLKSKI